MSLEPWPGLYTASDPVMRRWRLLSRLLVVDWLCADRARRCASCPLDEEQGHVALGLALRHLGNTGIFMQATAHPDDENNGLLVHAEPRPGVSARRWRRRRAATAARTRSARRSSRRSACCAPRSSPRCTASTAPSSTSRARSTSAISFSIEETFEKWGRDEIIGDFVRLIRTIRPDVMLGTAARRRRRRAAPSGVGGPRARSVQAGRRSDEVSRAAEGRPAPVAAEEVLLPGAGFGGRGGGVRPGGGDAPINLAAYDPLLGKTYAEIGTEARSMHKCQGMAQLLALPGPSATASQLVESTLARQTAARTSATVRRRRHLDRRASRSSPEPRPPRELTEGLAAIATAVLDAQKRFDPPPRRRDATLQPLLDRPSRGPRAARAAADDDARRSAADSRSSSGCARRSASFSRRFCSPTASASRRWPTMASSCPASRSACRSCSRTAAPRDADRQAGELEGFDGDATCTLTAPAAGGRGGGRGGRGARPPQVRRCPRSRRDQVGRCDLDADGSRRHARITEPYWHREGEAGRYTFDDDAPFGLPYRPTPFYVQVTLSFAAEHLGGDRRRCRFSTATRATSSAARNDPSCWSCRRCRCACRRRSRSCRSRRLRRRRRRAAGQRREAGGTAGARAVRLPPGRGRGGCGRSVPAPAPDPTETREVRVTVVNDTKGAIESVVDAGLPEGLDVHARASRTSRSRARTNRRRCGSRCERRRTRTTGEYQRRAPGRPSGSRRSTAAIR